MVRIYIVGIIALLCVSCSDFLKEYSQDLAYVNSYTDLDELLLGEVTWNLILAVSFIQGIHPTCI